MADIKITDVTNGQVDGDGVFDNLMTSVNAHLEDQYKKNRITGTDYATVYLGSLQAAMAQAIQFVLGEQQADKQADLLDKQIAVAQEQIDASQAETVIKQEQSAKDLEVKDQQISQSIAQEALITEQTESENKANEPDGVIDLQKLDITSQTTTRDNESIAKIDLMTAQKDKTNAEEDLIEQKKLTEEAQITNTVNGNDIYTEGGQGIGVVGKQLELFTKQIAGFDRDAEQKATKIMMDSYTTRRATNQTEVPPTKADNLDINEFIKDLALGIGVTLTDDTFEIGGTITTEALLCNVVIQIAFDGGTYGNNLTLLQGSTGEFKFDKKVPAGTVYTVQVLSFDPAQYDDVTLTGGNTLAIEGGGTITDDNDFSLVLNTVLPFVGPLPQ